MGNMVADSMRLHYPGVEAALTNSGGLRHDIIGVETLGGEAVNEITWGEVFAVLPFGNRTVIETLTGDQLSAACSTAYADLQPVLHWRYGAIPTGRRAGDHIHVHDAAAWTRLDASAHGPLEGADGPGGTLTPIGPTDTVRIVTNDFMFTGGDGYTALAGGTNVLQPGDALLDVTINHIAANSPVAPVVEGRIVGPSPGSARAWPAR